MRSVSERDLKMKSEAIRKTRALASVETMQIKSVKKGRDRLSIETINAEIQAARKARFRQKSF